MNVFEAVKQSVTTRQAAERYGIKVNRNGMCVCPFHNDKNPSMKVDRRFYCFGCGATGDVIDFVSRLHGISSKEAALMLAQDFSIPYEDGRNGKKQPIRPRLRKETEEQKFRHMERHCFQAFLIIVCVGIYAVLVENIALEDDIIGAIWSCVGYTVLLCFTLFKTGSLAKSIFAAH